MVLPEDGGILGAILDQAVCEKNRRGKPIKQSCALKHDTLGVRTDTLRPPGARQP